MLCPLAASFSPRDSRSCGGRGALSVRVRAASGAGSSALGVVAGRALCPGGYGSQLDSEYPPHSGHILGCTRAQAPRGPKGLTCNQSTPQSDRVPGLHTGYPTRHNDSRSPRPLPGQPDPVVLRAARNSKALGRLVKVGGITETAKAGAHHREGLQTAAAPEVCNQLICKESIRSGDLQGTHSVWRFTRNAFGLVIYKERIRSGDLQGTHSVW